MGCIYFLVFTFTFLVLSSNNRGMPQFFDFFYLIKRKQRNFAYVEYTNKAKAIVNSLSS